MASHGVILLTGFDYFVGSLQLFFSFTALFTYLHVNIPFEIYITEDRLRTNFYLVSFPLPLTLIQGKN